MEIESVVLERQFQNFKTPLLYKIIFWLMFILLLICLVLLVILILLHLNLGRNKQLQSTTIVAFKNSSYLTVFAPKNSSSTEFAVFKNSTLATISTPKKWNPI